MGKLSSAMTKILMCYPCCFSPRFETQHPTGCCEKFYLHSSQSTYQEGGKKDLGNADLCLNAVAYEDLEKIFEEIDKDVELNEKGDKMQCGFPIDSSSLSNLLAFFFDEKADFAGKVNVSDFLYLELSLALM